MKRFFESIGPAIIVAAVVLGPGSILTSSNVGATFGVIGFPVVLIAAALMIGMVALSARLGAVYDGSPCDELATRLGRPVAVFIGTVIFTLVAFFQSSNNIALIGGIEPLFTDDQFGFPVRAGILLAVNAAIIATLYLMRDLYKSVERMMKILIGVMTVAFLINFVVAFTIDRPEPGLVSTADRDLLPLLGMIGTTFSVAGAFYQAYLVKEKGWGLSEVRAGVVDSIVSISMLAMITSIILLTSWRVFFPFEGSFGSVSEVARQLTPLFGGDGAKWVFCLGILGGALSSFLVNAMIGGTIMSDSMGKGAKLSEGWPIHMTTAALLVGMTVAIVSLKSEGSTVHLITLAQALTVLGVPALALALIYLGTRPELKGNRKVPRVILAVAVVGFVISCVLAAITARNVYYKLNPPPKETTKIVVESID